MRKRHWLPIMLLQVAVSTGAAFTPRLAPRGNCLPASHSNMADREVFGAEAVTDSLPSKPAGERQNQLAVTISHCIIDRRQLLYCTMDCRSTLKLSDC
jgi:hypothetical protein